jgi:hypothetical protein
MPNNTKTRPDREKKRVISAFVDEVTFRDFKILAAENLATTDGMVTKAVALLFEKYKKPVPTTLTAKLRTLGLD